MVKWDGHTHTQFCKHGSSEHVSQYLDRAVELGFERYTVSEHPPLPDKWISDEQLFRELAMTPEELPDYFACVLECKRQYEGRLDVRVGLEFDYLPGQESFTEKLVNHLEYQLDDALISVHYLPGAGGMRCIDYTPDDFQEGLLSFYGSIDAVVEEYYNHVEAAIRLASAWPFSKRIGHINLIEKFRRVLPAINEDQINRRLRAIIPLLQSSGIGIDVNIAGFRKDTCGKAYASDWFIRDCIANGIECVYGSDAHHPSHVGLEWEWYTSLAR